MVIEKRNHIGGNCYDYTDADGILLSKYGAHLFHTNDEDVWKYVQSFSQWYPHKHKVLASVDKHLVPVPVNITTVNILLGLQIKNEAQMRHWMKNNQITSPSIVNSEQAALARVGQYLYEKLFKNYTKKQWDKYPDELDASVLNRIPVRYTFDDHYFSDTYQYLPREGYTKLFQAMLQHPNITVRLNTDFFSIKEHIAAHKLLIYTGPIDQYFGHKFSQENTLEYRSLRFVPETHDKEYYQSNSVINYPNEHAFTRIVEYKHLTGQKHPKTTIVKEYSTSVGEPYYPVPTPKNQALYEKYRQEAEALEKDGIYFVGRLANYKYINMDEAFKNALLLFSRMNKI